PPPTLFPYTTLFRSTTSLGSGGQGGQFPGLNLNPIQSVNREQIGTTLTITPQINDGGTMTLDISLESSELTNSTGDANSRITTKDRKSTRLNSSHVK